MAAQRQAEAKHVYVVDLRYLGAQGRVKKIWPLSSGLKTKTKLAGCPVIEPDHRRRTEECILSRPVHTPAARAEQQQDQQEIKLEGHHPCQRRSTSSHWQWPGVTVAAVRLQSCSHYRRDCLRITQ
eukprot:2580143-Rhodomonas_salina.1